MTDLLRDELCHFCGEYSCKDGNHREEVPTAFVELAKHVRVCRTCTSRLRSYALVEEVTRNVKKS